MLESALILMVLIALLIGSIDIGKVMFFHQGLVERARSGIQWAAVNPFNSTQVKNVVVYGTPSPAGNAQPVFYNLSTSLVSAELKDSNTSKARVEVRITNYPYEFLSPWIAGSYTARPIIATITHEPSLP